MRIYPALIVAILFCVFVVDLGSTTVTTREYLTSAQTFKFLLKNSMFFFGLEYDLPGVFASNLWKRAVNGSLWTLPYEVKMYAILVCILYAIGYIQTRFSIIRSPKLLLLLIASSALAANITNHFAPFAPIQFVHLFSMFFIGAAYFAWRDRIRLSSGIALIAFTILLASALNADVFFVIYGISLPYLTLFAAYVSTGTVRGFNSAGDYSYGMYIYAFPVQQSIAAIVPGISVAGMIAAAFTTTFIFAVLSWHLIEKRCLKLKGSSDTMARLTRSLRFGTR